MHEDRTGLGIGTTGVEGPVGDENDVLPGARLSQAAAERLTPARLLRRSYPVAGVIHARTPDRLQALLWQRLYSECHKSH